MIYFLGINILVRILFDAVGSPYNVHWCIAVHFFDYMTWGFVYMHVSKLVGMPIRTPSFLDSNRKPIWIFSLFVSCYYFIQALIELTYIGASWDAYNLSMFQEGYELSHSLAIVLGLVTFIYCKFAKSNILKWV